MQTISSWYQEQIKTKALSLDNAQFELIRELEKFLKKFAKLNFITRLLHRQHKLGFYIYGQVGRGKSMIMNLMYQFTETNRKTRLHFHEFMYDIHMQMAQLHNIDDPLSSIAKKLKQKYDIIYLDEMHVSDIATAMIMKRLLESLFNNKIYIITSSNYHPDGLWPDGLMRERFLPAIEIMKKRFNVMNLNAKQDYRLIHHSAANLYIIQKPESHIKLEKIFKSINRSDTEQNGGFIETCNRKIEFIKKGLDIIWFDFKVICGDKRSQLDYLELSKQFKWFILSDIYQLTVAKKDAARRLTWLIDVLYDHNNKLALSSSVLIKDIYSSGDFANEFERTISRLQEMQTQEYLQKDLTLNPL